MHQSIECLKQRFGCKQFCFEPGNGGLTRIGVFTEAAKAEIYTHGAHVTHFQPSGEQPVLWMSRESRFAPGVPLRGGAPVCWPWFGPHETDANAPMHGFARLLDWELADAQARGDGAVVTLRLGNDDRTDAYAGQWGGRFELRHRIEIGRSLRMTLETTNRGEEPFEITEALHAYFAVADVRNVTVRGLEGAEFIDKTDNFRRKRQDGPVTIAAETDPVYVDTPVNVELEDPGLSRTIRVTKKGSNSTVVWNPWIAKAKRMEDFGDDEWPEMICIEPANIGENRLTVAPGDTHVMMAEMSVAG